MRAENLTVVAHRGGASEAPENTLSAFRRVHQLGIGSVELDVRITRDDRVVVIHNEILPEASGVLCGRAVEELTWEELKTFNVGTRENPEPPPLLDHVLQLGWSDACRLMIELKTGGRDDALVQRVAEVVGRSSDTSALLWGSFEIEMIRGLHRAIPSVPLVGIAYSDSMIGIQGTLPLSVWALSVQTALSSSKSAVDACKAPLWCWTVNDAGSLPELVSAGVTGFITDRPAALRESLFGDGNAI